MILHDWVTLWFVMFVFISYQHPVFRSHLHSQICIVRFVKNQLKYIRARWNGFRVDTGNRTEQETSLGCFVVCSTIHEHCKGRFGSTEHYHSDFECSCKNDGIKLVTLIIHVISVPSEGVIHKVRDWIVDKIQAFILVETGKGSPISL